MLGDAPERTDGGDEEVGQGGFNMRSTQLYEEWSAVEASSSNDEVGMETVISMGT